MEASKFVPLSKRNATFQQLLALRENRNNRHREKRFLVEGVKPLDQLLRNQWPVESLLIKDGKGNAWTRKMIEGAGAQTVYQVSPELMAELSGKDEASELLAVAKMPALKAADLPIAPEGVYVVVDRPNSPGNLGSLIRTAEAFGAKAVITYGHSADLFDLKTISASIGALFALPLAHIESAEAFQAWRALFADQGITAALLGLDETGDVDCGMLASTGAKIVVIGNEIDGLSRFFRENCGVKVRIRMSGSATSLNAACSGSILLYELLSRGGSQTGS